MLVASRWPITVASDASGLDPCNGGAVPGPSTGSPYLPVTPLSIEQP